MKRRTRSKVHAEFSPFSYFGGMNGSLILMLLATLLLVVSFVKPGVFGGVRSSVSDLVSPLLSLISEPFQQAASAASNVTGISALRAENAQLKAENAQLREWYQTALMLQSENQSLHALLNVKPDPAHRFITARVIGDSGNAFVRSAIVAAGEDDGVTSGQAVLSGDGLIGRIIESGNISARILLLTDINSRVPVLLEGSRQKAILAGNNTDSPVLKYLPADSDARPGARIVTSGDGGMFMPGLPIGTIVPGGDGAPKVKLYSDISRLTHVRIVDFPESVGLIEGSLSTEPAAGETLSAE